MANSPDGELPMDDTWVTVTEAAEKTGYHPDYVRKLVIKNWKLPEVEREIPVRRHSYGYMLWLPALIEYVDKPGTGRGPRPK
jgi:hypothetical protein